QRMGMIPQEVVERQRRLLERFNLPVKASGVSVQDIRQAMSLDKKVQSGTNRWVLLEGVGRAAVRQDVPWGLVEDTLNALLG
ncbi:MAG TPA: 3-dehydroquinate synthase, partial [Dehalococcoidia bacterium]|nr:3-dehydroquinate synthase [Dehalococcoidia bacterium]